MIGHSCGTSFIVRWLGDTKQKIKELILVAPWKIPDKVDGGYRKKFYSYKIDTTIRSRVKEIVMFTADNEAENGKKSSRMFQKALGRRVVELHGRGHYTMNDMGTEEFPELLEEATKL